MKRMRLAAATSALVLLMIPAVSAAPNRANGASVEIWQYGVPVATVTVSGDFTLKGTGFRSGMPVNVCITGDYCMPSEVDATGVFAQTRKLSAPGTYGVTIYQPRNRQLDSWLVKSTSQITVTN